MKKTNLLMLTALLMVLLSASCRKEDKKTQTISEADAVEMTASALSANSNGLTSITLDAAVNAQAAFDLNLGCGGTKAYNYTRQSAQGATTTYNYTYGFKYTVYCNSNNVADYLIGAATSTGAFESPRMKATATGSGSLRIGGLTQAATVYVINGEYRLAGSFTAKTGEKKTSSAAVLVTVTNLQFNKSTGLITSGTAKAVVSTFDTLGTTVLEGTITFTAGTTAKFTVKGVVYTIDLLTGVVTK